MRSAASSSGAGSGLCFSVSSPPTTVSKRCAIGTRANASSTVERRFAVTTPSRCPVSCSRSENVLHAGARLEPVVQWLVVRPVDADELVDPLGREHLHLRLESGPADGLHQLRVVKIAAEHLTRRVPHRGEDDRA